MVRPARNPFRNEAVFAIPTDGSTDSVITGPTPGMLIANSGDVVDLLPSPAAGRLRVLRRQRDAAHVLALSDFQERQDLILDIQRHRDRIRQLQRARGADGYDLDADDVRVVTEQTGLDKKSAELQLRNELNEVRAGRPQILGTLITSAENWVRKVAARADGMASARAALSVTALS